MSEDIKLPALGEGIDSGDVAKIHVKEGSEVEVDTVLLELETEKALLELPSPVAGRITGIKISEGDTIEVGQSLFDVDTGGSDGDSKTEKEEKQDSKKKEDKEKKDTEDKKEKEKEKSEDRTDDDEKDSDSEDKPKKKKPDSQRKEKKNKEDKEDEGGEEEKEESEDTSSKKKSKEDQETTQEKKPSKERKEDKEKSSEKPEDESIPVPAGPGARRLARELGVDLGQVAGTARGGRITLDDVKAYTKQKMTAPSAGPAVQPEPLPDFTQWGEVETESIPSLRGKIASNLSRAWNAVPLVTQFDEADITELESLRKAQAEFIKKQGGKLTMTVLVLEALVAALKQHPQFNASVDLNEGVIHYKKYYNIGVAVDTPSGLIVPVIKNVDQKSVAELAVELTELSERARNRKVKLEELRGGNISISNLGGIGGTAFTPLVRPPEVAVVGLSRTRMQPVYKDGTFQPRLILPFCVSYDHKLIDGADAARFARTLAERLENFTGTLLQG
ncbi:2-oxo acid dehydrogenase subunit E2 [Nitrospina watsonii]|uniref:Dihydrolipoamide acetyltransferase component of pyruvate dehydrogenase complex n=1 Tax=Nitrospina watsonii TaxID=1323948 RepID=A0ABN8VUR9_9BACT|nr:2-oxo acid dehydrogenase subunit E2 [Nitrospina watsonii]CAI2717587.1 pyruvate dehydrogenase, dihydrolipoamide acetyltransferase component E2 [Nitrospina watsonii]